MRRLVFLIGIALASPAAAQCVVEGRGLEHVVRVRSDGVELDLRIITERSGLTVGGVRDGSLWVRGFLELRGDVVDSPIVTLQRDLMVGSMLHLGAREPEIAELRARSTGIRASVRIGGAHLELTLPCEALMLQDERQAREFHGGALGRPASQACSLDPSEEAAQLVHLEGRLTGWRQPTEPPHHSWPSWEARWEARHSPLTLREGPGRGARLALEIPERGELLFRIVEQQNGWAHVRARLGRTSWIQGWVRRAALEPEEEHEGLFGSLGTIGHGAGGGHHVPGRVALLIPGTDVFVSPGARAPWGRVHRHRESVLVTGQGPWLRVRWLPGISIEAPGQAWVRASDVRFGVSSTAGLRLAVRRLNDRRAIRVERVVVGSVAEQMGLREGDLLSELDGSRDFLRAKLRFIRDALPGITTLTVLRGGERVLLRAPCSLADPRSAHRWCCHLR